MQLIPRPRLILLESLKGIRLLGANFYQKFENFTILSYLSPHFYIVRKKMHPYYFCHNFVKPHNIFIIFGTL